MLKASDKQKAVIQFGDALTCAETGKQFIAAQDGCTTNYAQDNQGNVYSDEGVNFAEVRELLDRSKPFFCYLSMDGKNITGWKGNKLGSVVYSSKSKTGWNRSNITHVKVVDVHGGKWYGKGAGNGMFITIRANK